MIKKLVVTAAFCVAFLCSYCCMADVVYPPAKHPYVFVNDEYISKIKLNKENDKTYKFLLEEALKELPSLSNEKILDADISRQLEIKAFMYMMGEVTAEDARKTVDYTIDYLTSPSTKHTYSIDSYKDYGNNAIMTGSLVYDWCYSAMDNAQRVELAECIYNIIYLKDENGAYIQPCRPNNLGDWSDVAGKAVGQPLIYNSVAAASLYNVYPEIYEAIMPKIQGSMADIVKLYGQAGALSDRSISYGREHYAYYVARLFERMGYPDFYGNQVKIGYKYLYSRLPYGAYIKQGDDPAQRDYILGRYVNGTETYETMGLLSAMYSDPYLRFQYLKENDLKSDLFSFLLKESDTKAKLPDDLPLSFYVDQPGSEIIARTSWIDGITSPAAVGYMNMNNRRSGDHDHADIGNFQLYYKGPLTMPSGIYTSKYWGGKHWAGYYSRTVSSNCITVYDEDEDFTFGSFNINDGGQKNVPSPLYKYSEHMADGNKMSTEEGHYIGPNNSTPAFSYIKGDLTNAYSDKVTGYKRSMVFMDLFSDTYPAAMIVFDKISSSDASLPKKWLLQAVAEPVVSGDKITISNVAGGGGGMLINTVLYPQDVNIEIIGGIGKYIVNGEEIPADENCSASALYQSGYRCEVSPKSQATDDVFLNAMYVTDAGTTAMLPVNKVETAEFIGVTLQDRMVLFAKRGETVENSFRISVNNSGFEEITCLITDVEAGKWSIKSSGGDEIIAESKKDENVLCFKVMPGNYMVSPTDDSESVTAQNFPDATKQKTGDFVIKCDNGYINPVKETKLIDGVPYTCVEVLGEMGTTLSRKNGGYYATKGDKTIFVGEDAGGFIFNGTKIPLKNSLKIIDDSLYIPICEFSPFVGYKIEYNSESLKLSCNSFTKSINISGDITPVEITSTGAATLTDGYIVDGFSVPNEDQAIVFNLGNVFKIDSLKMFCQDNYDKIKIFASVDGNDYFNILPTITTVEGLRVFESEFVAKYIKIFSSGDVNVREIRVFGSEFENRCEIVSTDGGLVQHKKNFFYDVVKNYASNEKLYVTAFVGEGVTNLALYLGDTLLEEINSPQNGIHYFEYNIPDGISDMQKLTLLCDGGEYKSVREIFISDAGEYEEILSADFVGNQLGGEIEFTSNNNGELSFENNSAKISLLGMVESSEPFLIKRDVSLNSGKTQISFDVKFSSVGCRLLLELRDIEGKIPHSGAYYTICSGGKIFNKAVKADTMYNISIEIDTVNALMKVYVDGEFAGEKRLRSDGISQIRFCFRSGQAGVNFVIDNINVFHKNIGIFNPFATICAEKTENEVVFTINSHEYKAGKVKYIKVIKKRGAIFDVDIINFTSESEEEKVQTIQLPDNSYDAELYITSYYDMLDVIKSIKP